MSPEFLSLNPNNKIPAIIDPNGPDGEAAAAVRVGRDPDLSGRQDRPVACHADAAARYQTIQWLMFQMGGIGPMFGQVGFFHKFAGKDYEDKRPRDRYVAESKRLLAVLDQQLADHAWIVGDDYTIADIATFPWVNNLVGFYGAGELVGFDEFVNVKRALQAFLARPAVVRGLNIPPGPEADARRRGSLQSARLRIQSAVPKKAWRRPCAELGVDAALAHRLRHAGHPLVALGDADRKRQVARAQHRVAEALDVVIRPAEPAAEEPEQLVARAVERGRVQRAQAARTRARGPSGRRSGRPARARRLRRPAARTGVGSCAVSLTGAPRSSASRPPPAAMPPDRGRPSWPGQPQFRAGSWRLSTALAHRGVDRHLAEQLERHRHVEPGVDEAVDHQLQLLADGARLRRGAAPG